MFLKNVLYKKKKGSSQIHPMPGPNEWPLDDDIEPIKPPISKKQRGRPRKLRHEGIDENDPQETVKGT
jgi:hypothetical protein